MVFQIVVRSGWGDKFPAHFGGESEILLEGIFTGWWEPKEE